MKIDIKIDEHVNIFTPARVFTQVVCHLVDNACKFSPEGEEIQVRLQPHDLDGCVLTITDQGPGIPPDKRETVFERFSQMPYDQGLPENHGMGLGLFMARSFARTQNGEVKILDSASGCSVEMTLRNKSSFTK